jgi:hypothetical protein
MNWKTKSIKKVDIQMKNGFLFSIPFLQPERGLFFFFFFFFGGIGV